MRYGESVTLESKGIPLSITRWDDDTVSVQVFRSDLRVEVDAKATRSEIVAIAALFSKPKIDRGKKS